TISVSDYWAYKSSTLRRENFLKECKEKFIRFWSVRTFAGVDSISEVLGNSDVFDFDTGVTRVVHDHVSGKLSVYTSKIQKEIVSGIEILLEIVK
ncbi:13394_t:CDS:2, partial [Gigaspora rosea]